MFFFILHRRYKIKYSFDDCKINAKMLKLNKMSASSPDNYQCTVEKQHCSYLAWYILHHSFTMKYYT